MTVTYKCKENDTNLRFKILNDKIEEVLINVQGEKSWTVIGYNDFLLGVKRAKEKINEKEVDLKVYEPEKWFNYNVDGKEQYISIYNIKLKNKNER